MAHIALPWDEKYWQLCITHCHSTVSIWARLLGKAYSDRLEYLTYQITLYMQLEKQRPSSVRLNKIYLVFIKKSWHRVRVEDLDKSNANALCFFIDDGDKDWLAVDKLFICEYRFMNVPAQAVRFALFGLEEYARHPKMRHHLKLMLTNKAVVGEVLTNGTKYYNTDSSIFRKIKVVLFELSIEQRINLNSILLIQIFDEPTPPKISESSIRKVQITNVTDGGAIYFQILNTEFLYLKKLIRELRVITEQYKITEADLKSSTLFLICDDEYKRETQWYRGVLLKTPTNTADAEFDVYFVDYGITRRIQISHMFRLDSLSPILNKFPRQAIEARLHNIPALTKDIGERLSIILPVDSIAFVLLNKQGIVPYVTIYRQIMWFDMICNINEDLRLNKEIEDSMDGVEDDDDDDDTLVNDSSSEAGILSSSEE